MSNPKLTLENTVPEPSVVTYAITDASGYTVKLSLTEGQSIQHPVDPTQSPWVVTSELNATGTIDVGTQQVFSPTATITTSIALIVVDPSGAPEQAPSGENTASPAVFRAIVWETVGDEIVPIAAPGQDARLDFDIQPQSQTQWCWAAVASTVSAYYLPSSDYTQCKLANLAFGASNDCCNEGGSSICNQPWYLGRALGFTGNLHSQRAGRLPLSDVKTQIDNNHPIGVDIAWNAGGGHSVAIRGYNTDGSLIDISDPYGATTTSMNIDDFPALYPGGAGTWAVHYLTKA